MKTYIYTVANNSDKPGYNRTITVYRVKNNTPEFLGQNSHINIFTDTYRGDSGEAAELIARLEGFRFENGRIVSKNIKIMEV